MNTFSLITEHIPQLLSGVGITLALTLSGLGMGFLLALTWVFALDSRYRLLRYPVQGLIFFIRGTPALVQFFLVYFGSAEATWLQNSFLWSFFKEPFFCAALALAINSSAYSAELLRGAIAAIPKGELDACRTLGMSRILMLRRVLLPRAWQLILPAYSNEVVIVLKTSSLASTITLLDLMGVTRQLINETYAPLAFFLTAGMIYFLFNMVILHIFRRIERRYQHHTPQVALN